MKKFHYSSFAMPSFFEHTMKILWFVMKILYNRKSWRIHHSYTTCKSCCSIFVLQRFIRSAICPHLIHITIFPSWLEEFKKCNNIIATMYFKISLTNSQISISPLISQRVCSCYSIIWNLIVHTMGAFWFMCRV